MTTSANVTARGMSRAGWRNSLGIWALAFQPTNSHIKMLAAVPTAHQPWGAKGCQWWVTRDGRATLTATAMAATRAAERANWKPDETRRPRALVARTAVIMAMGTALATPRAEPARSAT